MPSTDNENENGNENENENEIKSIFETLDSTKTINPLPLLSNNRNKNKNRKSTSDSNRNSNRKSNWIHIDPCEAAVNENFIYESWGKSQNYIVSVSNSEVRDVTEQYTTKFNETVIRRSNSEVNQTYFNSLLHDAKNEILNYTSSVVLKSSAVG